MLDYLNYESRRDATSLHLTGSLMDHLLWNSAYEWHVNIFRYLLQPMDSLVTSSCTFSDINIHD